MQANWLDKAITWASPAAGLRRLRNRAAVHVALSYDGATTGRQTQGWVTGGSSANAEISSAREQLRQRSRDLIRNNPLAKNAKFQISSKLVGTGIIPRANTSSEAINKRIDELWEEFDRTGNADGPGTITSMQYLWAGAMFESGDVFIRRRYRRPTDGLRIPLQIQTLEADHLDTTRQSSDGSGYTLDGIKYDPLGRRVGYWMWRQHPGERLMLPQAITSTLIPAAELAHLYDGENGRPGQQCGVPGLHAVVRKMKDHDDLAEAKLFARKIEACFAVFVKQSNTENGPLLGSSETASDGKRIESLEPGMVEYLRSDEDVSFAEPKPSAGYVDESKHWAKLIAAGTHIPYELLMGDLSEVNYSSYRGSLLSFRDHIEAMRWNCFIPRALEVVWRWFIDACFLAGLIPAIDYRVEWHPPAFDLLDRLEEAKADLAEMRNGTMTWAQAVGRKGFDARRQAADIDTSYKLLDSYGIVLDCDPRLRTPQGNIPSGGVNAGTAA